MTWTADDAEIARLRAWLIEQGFVVLSDRVEPDAFDNQVVEMARPIGGRLVRDRDEWTVEVAGANGAWLHIREWRDAIREPGTPLLSATEQADVLRELLSEIESRASGPNKGAIAGGMASSDDTAHR